MPLSLSYVLPRSPSTLLSNNALRTNAGGGSWWAQGPGHLVPEPEHWLAFPMDGEPRHFDRSYPIPCQLNPIECSKIAFTFHPNFLLSDIWPRCIDPHRCCVSYAVWLSAAAHSYPYISLSDQPCPSYTLCKYINNIFYIHSIH